MRPHLGTVDGSEIRKQPVEIGSLSHYLHQGFQGFTKQPITVMK